MPASAKPRSPFSSWRRWGIAGFLVIGIAIAVGLLVGLLVGEQRGWIASCFAFSLVALIRFSWPVRQERWFWTTVGALIAVDVLAVRWLDWSFTETWRGRSFAGLAMVDLGAMMVIVYGLYRLTYGKPAQVIEEDPEDLPDYADRDLDL